MKKLVSMLLYALIEDRSSIEEKLNNPLYFDQMK